jgi:hypothetical protein
MILLRHGGFGPSCVVDDVPDAHFETLLLDHVDQFQGSVPGHFRPLPIPAHGSDAHHFSILPRNRSTRPCDELVGTCIETVNLLCKELT